MTVKSGLPMVVEKDARVADWLISSSPIGGGG